MVKLSVLKVICVKIQRKETCDITQNCMVQPDTRIYEEERNELHPLHPPKKIDKENI